MWCDAPSPGGAVLCGRDLHDREDFGPRKRGKTLRDHEKRAPVRGRGTPGRSITGGRITANPRKSLAAASAGRGPPVMPDHVRCDSSGS